MNRTILTMLQALPLDIKIARTKLRIMNWILHHGRDKVYVSFSGGKDSTVLAHLVYQVEREMYGNNTIPLVYVDTGLEFKELKEFVKSQKANVVIIRPEMSYVSVIKRYGYPVVSKDVSASIYKLKNQNLSERYKNYLLNGDERGSYGKLPDKHKYLIDSDFNIGAGCCDVMKKRPLHKYEKESGRYAAITGEMAEESRLRTQQYLKYGCNAFDRKQGAKSTPLSPWTKNDILEYIKKFHIEIPSVYGDVVVDYYGEYLNGEKYPIYKTTGYDRTGCIFCLYGIHLEKGENRLQLLKKTHPKEYDFCIRGGTYDEAGMWVPDKGLGLAHVLDTLGVEYK